MAGKRLWLSACRGALLGGLAIYGTAALSPAQQPVPVPDTAPALQPVVAIVPVRPAPNPGETGTAARQVNQELDQRVLGLVPNFLVVYSPHPVPLTSGQKFRLALRESTDPMAFVAAGLSAAYGQATDDPHGFGQGAKGFGKRTGASYGSTFFGEMTGKAILPSLLKQDPRYFYKGTGTRSSRFFYAVANSFICMGDNGHWQLNVSETMGSLATAGITELEYPKNDRYDVARVFENFVISKAGYGAKNIFQEFFSRHLTPGLGSPHPSAP
ncbi:MAG TPA: hypothetical protein VG225_17800 [Terracidiphilus sp.]|nr:hypothetical protein [Terracidiphilus sp.]